MIPDAPTPPSPDAPAEPDHLCFVGCPERGLLRVGAVGKPHVLRVRCECGTEHVTSQPMARKLHRGEHIDALAVPPPDEPGPAPADDLTERIWDALTTEDRPLPEIGRELGVPDPRKVLRRVEKINAGADDPIIVTTGRPTLLRLRDDG